MDITVSTLLLLLIVAMKAVELCLKVFSGRTRRGRAAFGTPGCGCCGTSSPTAQLREARAHLSERLDAITNPKH